MLPAHRIPFVYMSHLNSTAIVLKAILPTKGKHACWYTPQAVYLSPRSVFTTVAQAYHTSEEFPSHALSHIFFLLRFCPSLLPSRKARHNPAHTASFPFAPRNSVLCSIYFPRERPIVTPPTQRHRSSKRGEGTQNSQKLSSPSILSPCMGARLALPTLLIPQLLG